MSLIRVTNSGFAKVYVGYHAIQLEIPYNQRNQQLHISAMEFI